VARRIKAVLQGAAPREGLCCARWCPSPALHRVPKGAGACGGEAALVVGDSWLCMSRQLREPSDAPPHREMDGALGCDPPWSTEASCGRRRTSLIASGVQSQRARGCRHCDSSWRTHVRAHVCVARLYAQAGRGERRGGEGSGLATRRTCSCRLLRPSGAGGGEEEAGRGGSTPEWVGSAQAEERRLEASTPIHTRPHPSTSQGRWHLDACCGTLMPAGGISQPGRAAASQIRARRGCGTNRSTNRCCLQPARTPRRCSTAASTIQLASNIRVLVDKLKATSQLVAAAAGQAAARCRCLPH
jgi:hypothetical protein